MDSTTPTPSTPSPTPTVPLNVTDQQNSALLDDTLQLLSNGVPQQADQHGLAELDRWEEVLRASDHAGLAKIIQEITTLREQLTAEQTNPHDMAETLASLSAETIKVADELNGGYTDPLKKLAKLLIQFSNALSGG